MYRLTLRIDFFQQQIPQLISNIVGRIASQRSSN
jgi:hypothetical protein